MSSSTKLLLSQRHPLFYHISVWEKRIKRWLSWQFGSQTYAHQRQAEQLPYRVKKHQSKLIKKLGDSDMELQLNKVRNLALVIERLNDLIIAPGETFSFCKLVGRPTRAKGYMHGMELRQGEAQPGIGGGICQISNLLHWLVLHSPLTITERHHHSFDPFPDSGRVLPFASGATVFWNYRDFQFTNRTDRTFQIRLWLTERLLEGELRTDRELLCAWHVFEKNHAFTLEDGHYYRSNEIWRKRYAKFQGGATLDEEKVYSNHARVKYVPAQFERDLCTEKSG